jgi:Zn-dependent protease with chaperone function
MANPPLNYPPTPGNVNPNILKPSTEFKREAVKVLAAILFFIVTYATLIIAALGLAALCAFGGIGLIVLKPAVITLMLGLGVAGLGVMVVYFLIKFLFKRHKVDRSGLIEITEKQHPRLFQFVRKLANETQTSFPKKIFLSADVNASVFYDSSFWSMFLPVKKNLQIGLGLVNAVNISEFKAIIAHEFGHFSQRSMKLGSYVYNMNHIIFNLLYDNENYERTVEQWANMSGYFAFFALLTIRIVKGIQWILQQVYGIVNRIYMSLSRQMEFHADTVSASVSGGNHLVSSLRRLEVADITYNNVFDFYHSHFKNGFKPDNIYPQHTEIMRIYAEVHGLPFEHQLPQVDASSFSRFNRERVVVKNQWASHPSTNDREDHLRSLQIETPPRHDSAWSLFEHPEELQRQVTQHIFEPVKYESPVEMVNEVSFREHYHEVVEQYKLPSIYKGFFDSRPLTKIDLRDLEKRRPDVNTIEQFLTDEVIGLPLKKNGLQNDLHTVAAIRDGHFKIKNFEFDGQKFKGRDAAKLHSQLEKDLEDTEAKLEEADQQVIAWFLHKAEATGNKEVLREKYSEVFLLTEASDNDVVVYNSMQEALIPLYQVMQIPQIEKAIVKLKEQEVTFRSRIERMIYDPTNDAFITEEQRKTAIEYLSKEWEYFKAQTYVQQSLERLNECLMMFFEVLSERSFRAKLEVLSLQLQFAGLREVVV